MAKTDLVVRFPNKTARKHFMDWLQSAHAEDGYAIWMDSREFEDLKTQKLTILKKRMDYEKGVVSTTVGRMTDLRAINLSYCSP